MDICSTLEVEYIVLCHRNTLCQQIPILNAFHAQVSQSNALNAPHQENRSLFAAEEFS
jgi:hypothetical protein